MENKRPRSREQNNTGKGKGIFKRGATGNGPVGSGNAFNEANQQNNPEMQNQGMDRGSNQQQGQQLNNLFEQLLQQQQMQPQVRTDRMGRAPEREPMARHQL